ncbi:hypothetical protein BAE44_0026315 [Dichanthelium oligosanthes]|uniref:FBD domain-containing protein n=1 Tax=Dichanthelium oligosanthes TaxID=888268 RepID=A0A1E5UIL8_9POAL|nr:hypothetical protein BAE44_0026315 [Dichanthelium oligosanthes]
MWKGADTIWRHQQKGADGIWRRMWKEEAASQAPSIPSSATVFLRPRAPPPLPSAGPPPSSPHERGLPDRPRARQVRRRPRASPVRRRGALSAADPARARPTAAKPGGNRGEEAEAASGRDEEDEGRDLISLLPDGVLGDIITLLSAEEGARTQALSRRWQPLWRLAPLNLKAVFVNNDEEELFTMENAYTLSFPHLKQLTLKRVGISESSLHGMLSGCSVLESLLLCCNVGHRRLRIRSPTLRSLGVSNGEELIIEDAPLLERLFPRNVRYPIVIRVLHAPKLKKMVPVTLSTVVRTVKTLALIIASNLDLVVGLLKCFPCVEKLYIKLYSQRNLKNEQRYDQLECLDLHLKRLVLTCYVGNESEVNFTKFFVVNARVLEHMTLLGCYDDHKEWSDNQRKKLQLETRSSHGAEFDIKFDYLSPGLVHIRHIHDLVTDDPFEFDTSVCGCNEDPIWEST